MTLPKAKGCIAGKEPFKRVPDTLAGGAPVLQGNKIPQEGEFCADSGGDVLERNARMQRYHGHDARGVKESRPDVQRRERQVPHMLKNLKKSLPLRHIKIMFHDSNAG